MADVPARFKVDLSQVRGAFGEIRRLSGSIGSGQLAGVSRAVQGTNRELAASPGFAARFSAAMGRAVRVGAGIASVTVALVALNRRFPAIGQVAKGAFDAISKGANLALTSTTRAAGAIHALKVAGTAALAIFTLAKAFRALRGESSNLPTPKIPKVPTGGGGGLGGGLLGGGGLRGAFAGLALGGLALGAVTGGLKSASEFEQIEISFEVLTGGLEPAQKTLGEIREMAASTPFTLPGLADAGKTLLAFGLAADTVPKRLRMLGDIAGGNQQKLDSAALVFGQIASAGRLMGQDLLQLINLGFNPLQTIAERTGESMVDLKKRMEDGAVSFEEVEGAFIAATSAGGRFFGMTEKQSKTGLGLLSTLRDAIDATRRAFATPILGALKPAIAAVTEFFKSGESKAAAFGERIAQGLDFVRAILKTMGAGEIFLGVGKALQYGFQVAVDILVKGVQAALSLMGDANFMGEVAKGLEIAALKFKEILLVSVAAIVESLKGILPDVAADSAALQLRAGADLAAAQREAIEAEPRAKVGDLLERVRGEFEDARGLFGGSKNDALLMEVREIFSAAAEEAQRLTEERTKRPEGGSPGAPPSREGLVPAGGAGGSVAGAFQRAINLIQGRTVNELVAAEAQKTNDLLKTMNRTASDTKTAAERTARNTARPPKVAVTVVPTFGDNVA